MASSIDTPIGRAEQRKLRLLVVDDDEAVRDSLADVFELEGYVVQTAEDGRAAVALLQNELPNTIILNIRMPHSGWLVIDWLAERRARRVPVIVYTATGFSQGAFGDAVVVPKGGTADALLKSVKDVVSRY